jgi:hypothetical protein
LGGGFLGEFPIDVKWNIGFMMYGMVDSTGQPKRHVGVQVYYFIRKFRTVAFGQILILIASPESWKLP